MKIVETRDGKVQIKCCHKTKKKREKMKKKGSFIRFISAHKVQCYTLYRYMVYCMYMRTGAVINTAAHYFI